MTTIKSIEEKAKAYDEAIERAKKWRNAPNIDKMPTYGNRVIEEIFPELKESEDELTWLKRFIQEEIDCLSFDIRDSEDRVKLKNLQRSIAWLEKQGKQKETLCDECKKAQPSHSCQDITALGRCALEKQGEQKLTEFEKAVKQVMEEAIECGDTHNLKADAEMLLSLVHNSSWSEEDEAMWTEISDLLWEGYKQSGSKFSWDDIRNWVNSKLKSLTPQSTWKPSDEQMEVLKEVTNIVGRKYKSYLNSLYSDLNKLRKK